MKKKRFYARFWPLLIPACTVDTPVAEDPAAFDDRLGADLGAWCDSACAKFSSCGVSEDDCPEKCFDSFTTWFIGKGEICAESALRVMDCIDEVSCAELTADACNSRDERARCAASQGQVDCGSRGGGSGGSAGFGGTAGTGASTASCEVSYDDCADGHVYKVSCTGADPRECHCSIDDTSTGRFRYDVGGCPEAFEARQICAWPIVPMPDEAPTRPVSCTGSSVTGAAGGAPMDSCEIYFDDCSNAATYGIICEGGTGMCTCREDGEPVGAFISADTVCPYVFDPDGGTVSLNAACGFSIAWSTLIE